MTISNPMLEADLLNAIRVYEDREFVEKWQADLKAINTAADLASLVTILTNIMPYWLAHRRDPYAEVTEQMAVTIQQRSESLRQQWTQQYPDAKIKPMAKDLLSMRGWTFIAKQEVERTRKYTITIDLSKMSRSKVVRLLVNIETDRERKGVDCKARMFSSIRDWLNRHDYGDLWEYFEFDKDRERVKTTLPPGKFHIEIIEKP
jgi:hypothetical protein